MRRSLHAARGRGRPAARLPDHRVVHPHHRRPPPCATTPATTTRRCSCSRVPYQLVGDDLGGGGGAYVEHLLAIADRFAPGTSDLVATPSRCPPPASRSTSASPAGTSTTSTTPSPSPTACRTRPVCPLYAGSAGCHPAGSVIGAAGWNSAHRRRVRRTTAGAPTSTTCAVTGLQTGGWRRSMNDQLKDAMPASARSSKHDRSIKWKTTTLSYRVPGQLQPTVEGRSLLSNRADPAPLKAAL